MCHQDNFCLVTIFTSPQLHKSCHCSQYGENYGSANYVLTTQSRAVCSACASSRVLNWECRPCCVSLAELVLVTATALCGEQTLLQNYGIMTETREWSLRIPCEFLLLLDLHAYTIHQNHHHHYKHQRLDPLIRSVFRVRAARANASSVFHLFSFLVGCSGMISKRFGFVAFFASVKASSVCIHLSCLVCL